MVERPRPPPPESPALRREELGGQGGVSIAGAGAEASIAWALTGTYV